MGEIIVPKGGGDTSKVRIARMTLTARVQGVQNTSGSNQSLGDKSASTTMTMVFVGDELVNISGTSVSASHSNGTATATFTKTSVSKSGTTFTVKGTLSLSARCWYQTTASGNSSTTVTITITPSAVSFSGNSTSVASWNQSTLAQGSASISGGSILFNSY